MKTFHFHKLKYLLKNFLIHLIHFQSIQSWNQIMKNLELQGLLKSEKATVCGMTCIDLCNDTIKITGIHFSYNIFESITKIQNVLKAWQMRRVILEGKIIVFKTLANSKIAFLPLISKVPTEIISELERIQKTFLWPSNQKWKMKLYADSKHGGLKRINIQKKIINLQCSWVRRLYDDSFNEWKVISLKLIKNPLNHILNFTLIFYSICPVLMIFHPFT